MRDVWTEEMVRGAEEKVRLAVVSSFLMFRVLDGEPGAPHAKPLYCGYMPMPRKRGSAGANSEEDLINRLHDHDFLWQEHQCLHWAPRETLSAKGLPR
ncbi:hypothetical protein BSKO_05528 [Bryopsis sp. KO-2023]|nr:hypothetical protein BSKO_05528 [Bryopsis sp. KO-2023]